MDDAIRRVVDAAERSGVVVGIQGRNAELASRWMAEGVRFVVMGTTLMLLTEAASKGIDELRKVRRNRRGTCRVPAELTPGPWPPPTWSRRCREDRMAGQPDCRVRANRRLGSASLVFEDLALALNGELGLALRSLDWVYALLGVAANWRCRDHPQLVCTIAGGVFGAHRCAAARHRFPVADDLRAFQVASTGGFGMSPAPWKARIMR